MKLRCSVGWFSGLCAALGCGLLNAQVTVWTNMSGGVWNDAGNWDNGVPNGNMASLTRTTASYAVDIDSAPVPAITNLTVQNTAPRTTLLNVNTGTLAVAGGAIYINAGSEVCVKSNACLSFTGTRTTDGQGFFKTQYGGKLRVDGGSVCFTGLTSGAMGAIVGFSSPGYVVMTSGVFRLNGSGNPALYLARGQNAKGYFEAAGSSRVEVAQLLLGVYGYTHQPATGVLVLRDHAEFTVAGGVVVSDASSTAALCNTGMVVITDSATFTHQGTTFNLTPGSATTVFTNTGILRVEGDGRLVVTNATLTCGHRDAGSATVLITSNGVVEAKELYLNPHAEMTVSGNGCYTGVVSNASARIGCSSGGEAVLNVSDNGGFAGAINLYSGYDGGHSYLNVSGNGHLKTGGDFVAGYAMNTYGSRATINLSGNGVIAPRAQNSGRGLHLATVGTSSTSASTNASVKAWLNISGGTFDMTKNLWQGGPNYEEGIVAGEIWKNNQGAAEAWINLSGGVVTNAGKLTAGMGLGATGVVTQTGGAMNQGVTAAGAFSGMRTVLGWGGGCGEYRLSGGTAVFGGSVYVGGITTNLLGYVPSETKFTFEPDSAGLLRVEGGTLTITNSGALWCGGYGRGTIEMGTGGVCVAKNIVLTNNTQSTVRFELGEQGCGVLRATDTLTVCAGAKLEVDARAYRSRDGRLRLIDFGTRTGAFAPENVTVEGAGKVVQDDQGVWFYRPRGTVVQLN